MSKHDAIKEFFEPEILELAATKLNFNFSPDEPDGYSIVTNYGNRVIKEYVSGRARKAYAFSVIITKSYSTSADDLNLECMNFVQEFQDWIEAQNKAKNYPDFGEGCEIEKMEVLQNMPNLAGVNAEEGTARYMIQCRVVYME